MGGQARLGATGVGGRLGATGVGDDLGDKGDLQDLEDFLRTTNPTGEPVTCARVTLPQYALHHQLPTND
ncbi:MAG: hypothetical protein ACHBN1_26775 [Heteroscytonema crispum UTEX LB 1556]